MFNLDDNTNICLKLVDKTELLILANELNEELISVVSLPNRKLIWNERYNCIYKPESI